MPLSKLLTPAERRGTGEQACATGPVRKQGERRKRKGMKKEKK
jgi:hypothetical protein